MTEFSLEAHIASQRLARRIIDTCFNVRLEFESGARLPHDDEPAILVLNHTTETESVVTPGFLTNWPLFMWAKESLFGIPVIGRWLTRRGIIPVRGASTPDAIRRSKELLAQGHKIGVFGEGHRTDGKAIYKMHTGAMLLALETGTTVFAVLIEGADQLHVLRPWTWKTPVVYRFVRLYSVPRVEKPTKQQAIVLAHLVATDLAKAAHLPYVDTYYRKPKSRWRRLLRR